ncbi:hypothetical protein [Chitinophaga sp.]|uniref:hypothetical protein n=1 Tax=Chitinophaga sp. TaxID=1869181 RepID=UPI00261DEDA4|nr:hypothetical protein [uncultured Chitinophaga sp.]
MDIIAYQDFHAIRLSDFYDGPDYQEVEDYDFMGEIWVGELCGFNTFLRPVSLPNETRAISLDFTKDHDGMALRVLEALELPIPANCTQSQMTDICGEPRKVVKLAKDTVTMDFVIGDRCRYLVSCTIHQQNGLMYLDVVNETGVLQKSAKKKKTKEEKI